MALTGWPDRSPLGPPDGLVPKLQSIARRFREGAAALGCRAEFDPLALLGERAAIAGFERKGTTSCGGATRILATSDGWIALSLARPDDVALVPAWLEADVSEEEVWEVLTKVVARSPAVQLVERGAWLGLPVARLGELSAELVRSGPLEGLPLCVTEIGDSPARASLAGVRVVDLSSLWAGPLCGSLLMAAGADVVKVESTHRPDGARAGAPTFFAPLAAHAPTCCVRSCAFSLLVMVGQ